MDENPVANASVSGNWSAGASGAGACTTDASGQCDIVSGFIRTTTSSAAFTVDKITVAGSTYDSAANHDPDGDSDGTVIIVSESGPPPPTPTPTPTPIPGATIHVGDLDGSSLPGPTGRWTAVVNLTVHDVDGNPVANAFVSGSWSAGVSGSGSCTTDASGQCDILSSFIRNTTSSVVFAVDNVTVAGSTYDSGAIMTPTVTVTAPPSRSHNSARRRQPPHRLPRQSPAPASIMAIWTAAAYPARPAAGRQW